MLPSISRPATDEYNPYYADYIRRVPDGNVLDRLLGQIDLLRQLLGDLSEKQAGYRYAPDQWSIKEILGHLCDAERIFAYRAVCISRGEQAPLPGFEQDDYVREGHYDDRQFADLLQEFEWLRRANILTFRALSPAAAERRGTASGAQVSVRALVYIIAGHLEWHVESLRKEYLEQARMS